MIATGSRRPGLTKLEDNRGVASFPFAADCQEWWAIWGPRIVKEVGRVGWVLFILDAHEKLVEGHMLISRLLRSKSKWESKGWTPDEWGNVADITMQSLRWYENHASTIIKQVPEWAAFLIAGQYSNFCLLARLGREMRAAQEQGYSTVVLETKDGGIECTQGGDKFLEEVA